MALEDLAPTSSKRNWLQHNQTLRQQRERSSLGPRSSGAPGAARVLVVGDIPMELSGCTVERTDLSEHFVVEPDVATIAGHLFDAVVFTRTGDDPAALVRSLAQLVRPGGTLVGTAPAVRNRRGLEEIVGSVLSGGAPLAPGSGVATTRAALTTELSDLGLDVRWMRLVRDGWLDPLPVRPDGNGTVVESEEFLLRSVPADVTEELTAKEIVFAAVRPEGGEVPECSVVVAALVGDDPRLFAARLGDTAPECNYEVVIVESDPSAPPSPMRYRCWWPRVPGCPPAGTKAAAPRQDKLLVFVTAASLPHRGWLDALVQTHRSRPDTGAVGSKVHRTGRVDRARRPGPRL